MKEGKRTIAINAWVLKDSDYDGIANYTVNTIPLICKTINNHNFKILVDWKFKSSVFNGIKNCEVVKIYPPYRHPLLYLFFLEVVIPIYTSLFGIDLFLGMDGMISILSRSKQLPIIHDLNFFHYPKALPFRNRVFYNVFYKLYCKKADRIVTISEFSKNDIINTYHIDKNKVDVSYAFSNMGFHEIDDEQKDIIKTKYSHGKEYFLILGTIHPRKNIGNAIKAFDLFLSNTGKEYNLIIIGKLLWDNAELIDIISKSDLNEKVVLTGRISDQETNRLLGAAKALVFISLFEGFGMPLLEAFSTKTPVICSNTTSLDEIAGEAAIKVDPLNIVEIAGAMKTISENKTLNKELINKGKERLREFNWEKTAKVISSSIQKLLPQ